MRNKKLQASDNTKLGDDGLLDLPKTFDMCCLIQLHRVNQIPIYVGANARGSNVVEHALDTW